MPRNITGYYKATYAKTTNQHNAQNVKKPDTKTNYRGPWLAIHFPDVP